MPVAKVEAALEVEVISWRIGACVTMAVEVGVGTGAAVGTGRAGNTGFPAENRKNGLFHNMMGGVNILLFHSSAPSYCNSLHIYLKG